ncbi:MAG: hypothetical protein HY791_22480 [Deltaproteobacteria bacterium]|nr:hypothetical protein [Deltaproteobacteria bacterium]
MADQLYVGPTGGNRFSCGRGPLARGGLVFVRFASEKVFRRAAVHTGAPYTLAPKHLAPLLGLTSSKVKDDCTCATPFGPLRCLLYSMDLFLLASRGSDVLIPQATVAFPDNHWPEHRIILGMTNCLDQVSLGLNSPPSSFFFGSPIE